jgi:hypothetical protein
VVRERELDVLGGAWESVCAGSGRFVAIEGEPGVGKTTLAENFLAGISGPEVGRHEVGVKVVRVRGVAGDPSVADAISEALAGCPRPGERLVLFVDDAQWAGRESLAALIDAGWRLRSEPVLFVVAYQADGWPPPAAASFPAASFLASAGPAALHTWRAMLDSGQAVALPLRGLPPEDILRLAVASGRHGLSLRDATRLHEVTGGNPDYLLELFPLLPSNPTVIDQAPLPVPASRAAGVMDRFAACGPATRDLLCAAAVLGQRFSVATVREVARIGEPWPYICEAIDHALLETVPGSGNRELRFPRRVVADAIFWGIPERERVEWHRRCARLGGPGELRHRIAATDGVDNVLAADLRAAAAERALARDLAGAAYHLQRAMDFTERGPERTVLLLNAVETLLTVGKLCAAQEYLGELGQSAA